DAAGEPSPAAFLCFAVHGRDRSKNREHPPAPDVQERARRCRNAGISARHSAETGSAAGRCVFVRPIAPSRSKPGHQLTLTGRESPERKSKKMGADHEEDDMLRYRPVVLAGIATAVAAQTRQDEERGNCFKQQEDSRMKEARRTSRAFAVWA